jgi:cyclopropane-fatty-acyl-phospholipid synthase
VPSAITTLDALLDRGLLPDAALRLGIRRLLAQRLAHERRGGPDAVSDRFRAFIAGLRTAPIAVNTPDANAQHYEVPAAFYQRCLGPRLKYSSALYDSGVRSLEDAELAMLRLYESRAALADGQRILELGCGWGSLTLHLAQRFPHSHITAVSNSASQRDYILRQAAARGLSNLHIITADMNVFAPPATHYDRVVSVEMFEHMKNWPELFRRISSWLAPTGLFFMHVFTHRDLAYHFIPESDSDWMARHFFTGGMMPSDNLPLHFPDHLTLDDHWTLSGTHYAQTAEAWLANTDAHADLILDLFAATYGKPHAEKWLHRWRLFFLACAELWNYKDGTEWLVSHYRLRNR